MALATVLIGGVITSTALTLLVRPGVYLMVGPKRFDDGGGQHCPDGSNPPLPV